MTARNAAYRCLAAVDDDGAYANLALAEILRGEKLSARDAAFATELAYGAIRMRGLYDAIIAEAAGRPVSAIDAPVLRALRLGAHQALAMRVPAHAAVDETVALVRQVSGARATGFANAILRRIVEREPDDWMLRVASGDSVEALAIRHSHPTWIVEELGAALEAAGLGGELEALLASHNAPAPVTLVALPLAEVGIDPHTLASTIPGATETGASPFGVTLSGGNPGDIPGIHSGLVRVQDEGSQLAALALVAPDVSGDTVAYPGSPRLTGERWLDLCAGPGGKAALLGAWAARRGATLDALEVHPHRARLVRESVAAIPEGVVTAHVADGRDWTGRGYDRVLLDAPCSGFGALRRRPEARWRRSRADLEALVTLQRELLDSALRCVRPGGVVAYVTCSPVLAETRGVLNAAVEEAGPGGVDVLDARLAMDSVSLNGAGRWGSGPHVQLWTHRNSTDSMFIALIRKGGNGAPRR